MKTKLKDMPPKLKLVILAALGIFGVLLVIIGSSGGKKAAKPSRILSAKNAYDATAVRSFAPSRQSGQNEILS